MSTSAALHTEISILRPGDHLCCIYETEEEHRALLTPFLRQGLERNEKVVYIVDARTAEAVLGYLREDGVDPRPFLDRGQLVFLTVSDAYMRDGAFIPDRMISFLRRETDRAVGEGYAALRATGEMSWALRRLPGSHHLVEYEAKLNNFFPGSRCLALCQYDRRRFSAETLLRVLATHPIAVIGTETFDNVHYIPPEMLLAHDFSTAVLGHWIEDLRLRKGAKGVDETLRKSKALLEQTQRITKAGGWEYDVSTGRGSWTDEVYRIYELPVGHDLIDVSRSVEFYSPQDRAVVEGAFRRAVEEGEPYDLELQFIGARGTRKWVRTTAEVERVSGNTVRVFGNIQDVTDRKEAEVRARHLASIVQSSEDAIIGKTLDGLVTSWNPGAEKIYGYTEEEMVGQPLSVLIPPGLRDEASRILERINKGERVERQETTRLRKDGKEIRVSLTVSPIMDPSGKVLGASTIARDITERERAEEQLRHAQKLESLGVLAGGIAHDFNNLLMAILGHTDLALSDLPPVSPIRDHLEEVEKASQRAAGLCRQMLAYSGKGRIIVESLDLGEVLREMTDMLAMSISKKAILQYRFCPDLPRIEADASQVRQVVMNLVINASEAIGDDPGVITLATGVADCDRAFLRGVGGGEDLPAGRYVFFEVTDTGSGMDPETQKKIFDPFFTTKFTGRGLGMAAVLGIVRGHRGAIKVCSGMGKGTAVKVLLPAGGKAAAPVAAPGLPKEEWRGTGTVLLADDEEMVRRVGVAMLESLGFRVLTASDGREAVDVFRTHMDEIVCVVLDLMMPRMDGEEAFREIRILHPGARVIVTSGYNEQLVARRFVEEGLSGFIQKPYKFDDLEATLRKAIDG